MWPAKPQIFIIWPFPDSLLTLNPLPALRKVMRTFDLLFDHPTLQPHYVQGLKVVSSDIYSLMRSCIIVHSITQDKTKQKQEDKSWSGVNSLGSTAQGGRGRSRQGLRLSLNPSSEGQNPAFAQVGLY